MRNIPVYEPIIGEKEKEYVLECLDTNWISSNGKFVNKFEEAFAKYLGNSYATAVSNGTVALHLALLTLGIGEDDEVIVPSFTYVATANSITYVGAKPVFVDSKLDDWQIDPEDIKKKISNKTKAIIVVHLYGHPCDMDEICKICNDNNIYLIEDCAEAIGSEYKGRKVGTFGDLACFSFFGNKTITTGEGGMVVGRDKSLIEKAAHLKDQGMSRTVRYWHDIIGYNFRMTNIQAAIGYAQIDRIEDNVKRKIEIGELYNKNLIDLPLKTLKPVGDVRHTYWMCSILLDDASKRDSLHDYLYENGIDTRPSFYPVHCLPMYEHLKSDEYVNAEYLGSRGMNLPSFPGLKDDEVIYICDKIKEFFKG